MALKPIACLCFFVKALNNEHFLNKKHNGAHPIWKVSRPSRPSRLCHRHRVGIRPPIHTRGSEDSVSLHKANSLKLLLFSLTRSRRPLSLQVSERVFHITDQQQNIMLREIIHETLLMHSENLFGNDATLLLNVVRGACQYVF